MSIGIIIDDPKNEEEKLFYIPLATEKTFENYWNKAANQLNLQWVPVFSTGITIEYEDLPFIINELNMVFNWVKEHVVNLETQKELLNRIEYILENLTIIFKQESIKLYIG